MQPINERPAAAPTRIDFIDGLRGLAILIVVAYHFFVQVEGVPAAETYSALLPIYFIYLGASLFFAISGYVIFMTLDNTPKFSEFIARRWIRLFPAMLLASLLIFLIAYYFPYRVGGMPRLIDIVPGLSLLGANIVSALSGQPTEGLEGGFWTVYVEVRFYVLFGLCYYILGRRRAFVALVALAFALFVLLHIAPLTGAANATRAESLLGKILIGFYLPWFLLGMHAYLFGFKQQRILLLLIAGSALAYNATSIGSALANLALLAVLYGAFTSLNVQSIFKTRVLLFFGFVSYPLYLLNDSVGRGIVRALYEKGAANIPFEVFPFVALGIVLIPVWIIARYLEPAVQAWLKRRVFALRAEHEIPLPLKQGL